MGNALVISGEIDDDVEELDVGDQLGVGGSRYLNPDFRVEQGWARQGEVACAFEITARTMRRHQRRFEDGGLVALGRVASCPKDTSRVAQARARPPGSQYAGRGVIRPYW